MAGSIEKIIVVVGCQRSGTTLTAQILGAHPRALMIDETDGLYDWFPGFVQSAPDTDAGFSEIIRVADKKYQAAHKRCAGKSSVLEDHITHLILKAPNLTFDFALLARLNIPLCIVYPVRDARAVVASMAKLPDIPFVERQLAFLKANRELAREFQNDVAMLENDAIDAATKRALVWKIKSSLAGRFSSAGLSVLSFQYEQLVADSAGICAQITAHVGLEFDEKMLRHEEIYTGIGPGGTQRFRAIDQTSLTKWQDSLSIEDEQRIMAVASSTMQELGYAIAASEQSADDR